MEFNRNKFSLKFKTDEQEQAYQDYSFRQNIFKIRVGAVLGIILFIFFGVIDYLIIKEIIPMVWVLRLTYIIVGLFYIVFTFTKYFEKYSQFFMSLTISLGGLIIIATMALIDNEAANDYYVGLLVLIMFVNFFGVQFKYSIWVNIFIVSSYNLMEIFLNSLSTLKLINNNFFLISGVLIGLLACFTLDATSRKIYKQRLRIKRAVHDAQKANQAKSGFLANMSHEIRTPLNAVLGFTQILMIQKQNDEQTEKYLTQINESGQHLVSLVDNILDISKIEASKMSLSIEEIDIRDLIKKVHQMLRVNTRDKKINFTYNFEKKAPKSIYSDYTKLKQILVNIISNAIKFTEKGKVEINLRDLDDGFFEISISDEGIGIKKENLELIFSNFEQEDGSTTRNFGGTGLGLAISKGLVELLNGKISVESQVGKGSTFFIHLPVKDKSLEELNDLIE